VVGQVPEGWTNVRVDYTITMPGWVLEAGTITPQGKAFTITYDPEALSQEFPNLDLRRQYSWAPGLVDSVFISFAVFGDNGGTPATWANVVALQGEQVFVEGYQALLTADGRPPTADRSVAERVHLLYLPMVAKGYDVGGVEPPEWCRMTSRGWCVPTDQPVGGDAVLPYHDELEQDPNQDMGRVR
jgi:hypothetical protein